MILFGLAIWILSLILCPMLASNKGRSVGWAIFWAVFLGAIALIYYLCVPAKTKTG